MVVEGVMIQSPVLFGESEDPNLLGLVALEVANLSVDPSESGTLAIPAFPQSPTKHVRINTR